jgi:hypothetical protein
MFNVQNSSFWVSRLCGFAVSVFHVSVASPFQGFNGYAVSVLSAFEIV